MPARAIVDLDAISHNVRSLAARTPADVMAVVKSDAYGHGLVPAARAALAGGATWLGVAQLGEALELRRALTGELVADGEAPVDAAFFPPATQGAPEATHGPTADDVPILCWLHAPGAPYCEAISARIDLAAATPATLQEIASAAREVGTAARVHLKVDTGMARGGASEERWIDLVRAARSLESEGALSITGIFSHLAASDEVSNPLTSQQRSAFDRALTVAGDLGAKPEVRHLANSAALCAHPDLHYDLVRPGIAIYGLSPGPDLGTSADLGLTPAMRLEAELVLVKDVPAGTGVSYGHDYYTERDTRLGLVPLGYADGIPRHASGRGPVAVDVERRHVAGRVCMDQFVIDLGPESRAKTGDQVVLFGDPADGVPGADEWAQAAGTINYEIVARLGARIPREYRGGPR